MIPRIVPLAGALLAAGAATSTACARAAAAERPNVVLVVVDTLRADHLGCHGYERETTPRLDQLAAGGLRFERAFSQAPWTTPSVASLLTSLYPTEIGIGSECSLLPDELTLLPEVLAAQGYRTGAVISHTFCSERWNFDQGFDWFDQSNVAGHAAISSPGVTARALEFADWAGDAPFFLWLHYFDPHFYYNEHPEHAFGGRQGYSGPIRPGLEFSRLLELRNTLTAEDLAELRRLYDSEIAFTDGWIGALFDGLRARGLWERTLVIATGDHGEEFGDHGDIGHARTLYQELVNVPLIVKLPHSAAGPPAGTAIPEPVALIDVFPTVLELTGTRWDGPLQGRSLLAARDPARALVSETARAGGVQSLVSGDYKLIRRLDGDLRALYHLGQDPRELRDLSASHAREAQRLGDALEAWERSTRRGAAAEIELTSEELDELRELGYAGADEGREDQQ
jgi:arylsulfatase A-like enzyme